MKTLVKCLWAVLVVLPWLFMGVAALAFLSTNVGAAVALVCIIVAVLAWDKLSEYDKVR